MWSGVLSLRAIQRIMIAAINSEPTVRQYYRKKRLNKDGENTGGHSVRATVLLLGEPESGDLDRRHDDLVLSLGRDTSGGERDELTHNMLCALERSGAYSSYRLAGQDAQLRINGIYGGGIRKPVRSKVVAALAVYGGPRLDYNHLYAVWLAQQGGILRDSEVSILVNELRYDEPGLDAEKMYHEFTREITG